MTLHPKLEGKKHSPPLRFEEINTFYLQFVYIYLESPYVYISNEIV